MNDNFAITDIKRIIYIGKNEYPEKRTVFSANIRANELIFRFSGKSTVYFGDRVLKCEAGTVRFLPIGEHGRYEVVREECGECIDVFFYTDRPISEQAFTVDTQKSVTVAALFKRLFSLWISKAEGYRFRCMALLYEIFAELQDTHLSPSRHTAKIQKAVDKIHGGFLTDTFRVDELAALCGMRVSYFTRLFKETYGVSPIRYVIHLKLEHACEMLRTEQYSVTEVAELCHFSDVYFFSRQFKAHFGITPTQFMQKYRSSK